MTYLIMLGGIFLGSILFMFIFIISKKSGKYYLAPIITILFSAMIVAYSLFFVGGFEGMAYLFVAVGFLFVSILGALFLPFLIRRREPRQLGKRDKISLLILPVIFFATIGIAIWAEQDYSIIYQTRVAPADTEGYKISTISEGRKAVTLLLGEEYVGTEVEVESVSERDSTEITLNFEDEVQDGKVPFIQISLKEINEPLTVQTADGQTFEQINGPPVN
ncbi:YesK family protein [Salinicoccus roseus]|uniref:YesK family protein n=1 Tax=Salinicoccus roseus TaxID=45670 RepID=UPI000F4F1A64|nr:YesK family protein [Salinicoccus roseus]RPE54506.1 YesK-like protein [Salinicoccus roseus]GGA64999.1 hypothetical protein GCM10007176_06760 [Salinicoccus roseus]